MTQSMFPLADAHCSMCNRECDCTCDVWADVQDEARYADSLNVDAD